MRRGFCPCGGLICNSPKHQDSWQSLNHVYLFDVSSCCRAYIPLSLWLSKISFLFPHESVRPIPSFDMAMRREKTALELKTSDGWSAAKLPFPLTSSVEFHGSRPHAYCQLLIFSPSINHRGLSDCGRFELKILQTLDPVPISELWGHVLKRNDPDRRTRVIYGRKLTIIRRRSQALKHVSKTNSVESFALEKNNPRRNP